MDSHAHRFCIGAKAEIEDELRVATSGDATRGLGRR
jgi:hypothetical protein